MQIHNFLRLIRGFSRPQKERGLQTANPKIIKRLNSQIANLQIVIFICGFAIRRPFTSFFFWRVHIIWASLSYDEISVTSLP
jgi:hypothetical protein